MSCFFSSFSSFELSAPEQKMLLFQGSVMRREEKSDFLQQYMTRVNYVYSERKLIYKRLELLS